MWLKKRINKTKAAKMMAVKNSLRAVEAFCGVIYAGRFFVARSAKMFVYTGIFCLVEVLLSGCMYQRERTYPILTEEKELSALPCQRSDRGGFLGTRLWSPNEVAGICSLRNQSSVAVDGVTICAGGRRCSDEALLLYQPCAQPMPAYYGNLLATQSAEGILLIHPVTRTQVFCYDQPSESAIQCAENFRAAGYVLVTDIPQVTARYDFLRANTYPTRRWRNGETVPRW